MANTINRQESFILYFSDRDIFDSLTNEEAGELIKSIFSFKTDGEIPEFESPMVKMGFNVIKGHLIRDAKKYSIECAKRQKSAYKKHWLDTYGSEYTNKFERDKAFEAWWSDNANRELADAKDDEDG